MCEREDTVCFYITINCLKFIVFAKHDALSEVAVNKVKYT